MAKITPSPLVNSVRGRLGSIVFQRWRNINTVRSMPLSIHNPSTARQSAVRNQLSLLKTAYSGLSPLNKVAWDEYAQSLATQLPVNQIGTFNLIKPVGNAMSGYNAFVGVNSRLSRSGLGYVLSPPTESINGPTDVRLSSRRTSGGYGVEAVFGVDDLQVGSLVRFFIKTNWPGGHTYLYHTHVVTEGDLVPVEGEVLIDFIIRNVRAGFGNDYLDVPLAYFNGKDILFQADVVSMAGAKSSNSNVLRITIDTSVDDNLQDVYDSIVAGAQTNFENYATNMGVPTMTGVNWLGHALVQFAFSQGIAWSEVSQWDDIATALLAGFPDTVSDLVMQGYLPEVPDYDKYDTTFTL